MSEYSDFGKYATNKDFQQAMQGAIPVVASAVLDEQVPPRPIDPLNQFADDTLTYNRYKKRVTLANSAFITADRYASSWGLSVMATGTIPIKANKPDITDPAFDSSVYAAILGNWDSYAGVTPDEIVI